MSEGGNNARKMKLTPIIKYPKNFRMISYFFAVTSYDVIFMMTSSKIRQNIEMTIIFDLQIVEKWLTSHFICITETKSKNDDWAPDLAIF